MALGELLVRIGSDVSDAMKGFDKVENRTQTFGQRMDAAGKKAKSAGRSMSMGLTLPAVGAGAAVLKTAGDFESGMKRVQAITGATGDDFEKLEGLAKRLGKETAFSASEAAEGMTELARTGFDVDEIMDTLPATLDAAAAGQMNLGDSARIASDVVKAFGLETENTGEVVDTLTKASTTANTTIQKMGQTLGIAGPLAASAGTSMESTVAAAAKMQDAGIKASRAGTSLRRAFGNLISPTDSAQKTLDNLGVSVRDSQGNMRDLLDILGDMEKAGATNADILEVFGQRAGPNLVKLLDSGIDGVKEYRSELEDSGGAAEKIADKQLEGLNGRLKVLKSSLENLAITIADTGLLGSATAFVETLTEWANTLSQTNPFILKTVLAVVGLLAVLGPLLFIMGTLISSAVTVGSALATAAGAVSAVAAGSAGLVTTLGVLAGAVLGIAAVVAALWVAWKLNLFNIQGRTKGAVAAIKGFFSDLVTGIMARWTALKSGTVQAWNAVVSRIMGAAQAILSILEPRINFVVQLWKSQFRILKAFTAALLLTLKGLFTGNLDLIKQAWSAFLGIVSTEWQKVWDALVNILRTDWNRIKGVLSAGKDAAMATWDALVSGLTSAWDAAWQGLVNLLTQRLPRIVDRVATFAARLPGAITSGIGDIGTTVWDWFTSKLSSFMTKLEQWARGTLGLSPTLTEIGGMIVTSIKEGIGSKVSAVANAIQGYATDIKDDLVPDDMWSAGWGMVDSFAQGIRDGISMAVDAAKDLAGRVGSYLPSSPADRGPLSELPDFESFMGEPLEAGVSLVNARLRGLDASPGIGSNARLTAPAGGGSPTILREGAVVIRPQSLEDPERVRRLFDLLGDETAKLRRETGMDL